MRVLLTQPWIHDFTAYDLWIQPLGLLYLAGVLKEQGFDLDYIDCLADRYEVKVDGRAKFRKQELPTPAPLKGVRRKYGRFGITPEEFRLRLKALNRPDAILVTSGMTYWYPGIQETISEIRSVFPETKIILGGIYATLMPAHARASSGADVVIPGQFENRIANYLNPVLDASPYRALDDYPLPAWNLVDEHCPYRILMTSRGCPYRCTFCASDILNEERFMQRKIENIVDEIEGFYHRDNIRHFVFYDDALLIAHKRHLEPLLEQLIQRRIRAFLHTPNGLNAREVSDTVARLFFESGFRTIRLSLESSNPEIQKNQGDGKVNNQLFEKCIRNLYRAGYQPGELECYLILGLPGQDLESVRKSLRFVNDLGVVSRLAVYSPIPGTREAQEVQQWIGADFLKEPLLQNHASFPLRNQTMSESSLDEMKQECASLNQSIRAPARNQIGVTEPLMQEQS